MRLSVIADTDAAVHKARRLAATAATTTTAATGGRHQLRVVHEQAGRTFTIFTIYDLLTIYEGAFTSSTQRVTRARPLLQLRCVSYSYSYSYSYSSSFLSTPTPTPLACWLLLAAMQSARRGSASGKRLGSRSRSQLTHAPQLISEPGREPGNVLLTGGGRPL
jgi:hypothetical protein